MNMTRGLKLVVSALLVVGLALTGAPSATASDVPQAIPPGCCK
jgi:hypothetical protein